MARRGANSATKGSTKIDIGGDAFEWQPIGELADAIGVHENAIYLALNEERSNCGGYQIEEREATAYDYDNLGITRRTKRLVRVKRDRGVLPELSGTTPAVQLAEVDEVGKLKQRIRELEEQRNQLRDELEQLEARVMEEEHQRGNAQRCLDCEKLRVQLSKTEGAAEVARLCLPAEFGKLGLKPGIVALVDDWTTRRAEHVVTVASSDGPTFAWYDRESVKTAGGPYRLERAILGVGGEAGELLEAQKKHLRGDYDFEEFRRRALAEVGDGLWYGAEVARMLGSSIEEVAQMNVQKLADRAARNVIQGDGDRR